MRTSTERILNQLANEGVRYSVSFGLHWLDMRAAKVSHTLATGITFPETVNKALSHTIRITTLLSKLQDAISAEGVDEGKGIDNRKEIVSK